MSIDAGRLGAVMNVIAEWRARRSVSAAEITTLAEARAIAPAASIANLLVVCQAGVRSGVEPDLLLTADEIVSAFARRKRAP